MKITLLQADVTMFGSARSINWEEGERVFAIFGVESYAEAQRIMQALGIEGSPADSVVEEVREADIQVREDVAKGSVPTAPPITRPLKENQTQRYDLPASGGVAARTAAPVTGADITGRPPGQPEGSTPSPPTGECDRCGKPRVPGSRLCVTCDALVAKAMAQKEPATASDDLGAFANMGAFAEVVAEIRKRGSETYEAILAFCLRLQGIGDVCPPLDQLTTGKGPEADRARLEDRLKTHLTGKGIKVPA